MKDIKETPLHSRHVALGAQMSPFAGYDMPIQYKGIVEEHNAVRNACGVFDVSHMGEVFVRGAEAEMFVNRIFTKDVTWIKANAAGFAVVVEDVSDRYAQIAIQGPEAEKVMAEVLGLDYPDMAFYTFEETEVDGEKLIVSRTGYTGEDGFELYGSPELICRLWDKLIESGKAEPCGLGCRDTLRFEVGLPLYGDELADDITPLEAGLGIFVKFDKKGGFLGRKALEKMKEEGIARKLVGLEIADRAIARHGYEVLDDKERVIGHVTTGYRGISVDKSIALALIETPYSAKDTEVQVKIRRKTFPAKVTAKKFYKKSYKA